MTCLQGWSLAHSGQCREDLQGSAFEVVWYGIVAVRVDGSSDMVSVVVGLFQIRSPTWCAPLADIEGEGFRRSWVSRSFRFRPMSD